VAKFVAKGEKGPLEKEGKKSGSKEKFVGVGGGGGGGGGISGDSDLLN